MLYQKPTAKTAATMEAYIFADAFNVLSVSPISDDHTCLHQIFPSSESTPCTRSNWNLFTTAGLNSAIDAMKKERVAVVICERDLGMDSWREVLDHVSRLPEPPLLIVASRLADNRLWAEALDLGAYDVLAKPFDPTEVLRVVRSAWQHWQDRRSVPSAQTRQVTA